MSFEYFLNLLGNCIRGQIITSVKLSSSTTATIKCCRQTSLSICIYGAQSINMIQIWNGDNTHVLRKISEISLNYCSLYNCHLQYSPCYIPLSVAKEAEDSTYVPNIQTTVLWAIHITVAVVHTIPWFSCVWITLQRLCTHVIAAWLVSSKDHSCNNTALQFNWQLVNLHS